MIRYQGEDKELGGAEVQEEEAKEQGQATWEEEPQEDKARRNKASGRGTTALNAVLPRWPRYYRTTVLPCLLPHMLLRQQKIYGSTYGTTATTTARQQRKYGSSRGTTAPAVLPRPRYYRADHGTTVLPARRFGPMAPVSESGPP